MNFYRNIDQFVVVAAQLNVILFESLHDSVNVPF